MSTHFLTMPGDWNHPGLLLRLMEVVESRWQATMTGFQDTVTGATVGLAFGGRVEGMRDWFADGGDPTRPELSDDLLEAIDGHHSVVQVQTPFGADPMASLEIALSAANSIVDGGALGVHVMSSGLAHEADAYQALMRGLEGPGDHGEALFRLAVRYQLGDASATLGMAALGLPDVLIPHPENPDRAVGRLEATALRLLAGEELEIVPDRRDRGNPNGFVVLTA